MSKKRKRHNPEEVVRKLRDADAMLAAGKDLAAVLQALVPRSRGHDPILFPTLYALHLLHQRTTSLPPGQGVSPASACLPGRDVLWNAAKAAVRVKHPHNPFRQLFDRLVAKGKSKPSAYGAVSRKLVQVIYGVLKSQTPFQYAHAG